MTATVLHIAAMRLWNNKLELLLAFVVPILFFSIFALIFGRGVASETSAIKVAFIDDDGSSLTKELVGLLRDKPALEVKAATDGTRPQQLAVALSRKLIRQRNVDVVVHLPNGMETRLQKNKAVAIGLLSEGTNPVGGQIVSAVLSQAVAGALTQTAHDQQPAPPDSVKTPSTASPRGAPPPGVQNSPNSEPETSPRGQPVRGELSELISFKSSDVFAVDKRNPKIAMYAAGIAVMFLLFSASGAGGSLLEEHEAGTLDRLLSSRLTVTQLLAGKWLYITLLGCAQLTAMFAWAQIAFDVDLLGHLSGFIVMTMCTAAASASLALCLAVVCRSRSQLNVSSGERLYQFSGERRAG